MNTAVSWGGIMQYCCAVQPSSHFGLKDFFSKLLGMLSNEISQSSSLIGNCFCWRKLPCSSSDPLLGEDCIQWQWQNSVKTQAPYHSSDKSNGPFHLHSSLQDQLRHYCDSSPAQLLDSSQSCFIYPSKMVTPRAFFNKILLANLHCVVSLPWKPLWPGTV